MKQTLSGVMLAQAVAALFISGAILKSPAAAGDSVEGVSTIKCLGVNSCKGQGSCKSADNTCKGQNGCEQKGWVELSADDCMAKGGKELPESK